MRKRDIVIIFSFGSNARKVFKITKNMYTRLQAMYRNFPRAPAVYDDIIASILKFNYEDIIHPLFHLCKLSLDTGFFAKYFELVNVIPLYKNNSFMLDNYRSVCLLCIVSMILKAICILYLLRILKITTVLINSLSNILWEQDYSWSHLGFRVNQCWLFLISI